jgi:hypothetical protein
LISFRSQSPQRRLSLQMRAQMHSGSVSMNCITCRYWGTRTAVQNDACRLLLLLSFWWQQCNDFCICSVDSDCCNNFFQHVSLYVSTSVLVDSCAVSRTHHGHDENAKPTTLYRGNTPMNIRRHHGSDTAAAGSSDAVHTQQESSDSIGVSASPGHVRRLTFACPFHLLARLHAGRLKEHLHSQCGASCSRFWQPAFVSIAPGSGAGRPGRYRHRKSWSQRAAALLTKMLPPAAM